MQHNHHHCTLPPLTLEQIHININRLHTFGVQTSVTAYMGRHMSNGVRQPGIQILSARQRQHTHRAIQTSANLVRYHKQHIVCWACYTQCDFYARTNSVPPQNIGTVCGVTALTFAWYVSKANNEVVTIATAHLLQRQQYLLFCLRLCFTHN